MNNKKLFLKKGKLNNLRYYIILNKINIVIFDGNLCFSEIKNLEFFLKCNVIDRNLLILDIFSIKAKSFQMKVLIKLIKYKYLLPRLTKMWTYLSQQKGGIGLKGLGESKLEIDKRIIKKNFFLLKKKISLINKKNFINSKLRNNLINVSVVGYTNSGKSTFINVMSKSNLYSKNSLFSTLGFTTYKVVLKCIPFLVSDTVGFIQKLPFEFIKCFKLILYGIQNSDILTFLVDISYTFFKTHIKIVEKILYNINISYLYIPKLIIFNKIDKIDKKNIENQLNIFNSLSQFNFFYFFKKKYKVYNNYPLVFISIKKKKIKKLNFLFYNILKRLIVF